MTNTVTIPVRPDLELTMLRSLEQEVRAVVENGVTVSNGEVFVHRAFTPYFFRIERLLDQLKHTRDGTTDYPEEVYARLYATMERRRLIGLQVHGQKLDEAPEKAVDWLKHAMEESMDMLVYMQATLLKLEEVTREADNATPARD